MRSKHLVGAAFVALSLTACSGGDPDSTDAYKACEKAIEDHFDATGIEGFSGYDNAQVTTDGASFKVQTYIDAESSTGKPERMKFTCELRGDLKLVSLDVP